MIVDWIGRVLGNPDGGNGSGVRNERAPRVDGAGVLSSLTDSTDRLNAEIDRARRYEHALSVVALSAVPMSPEQSGPGDLNGDGMHAAVLETRLPQVLSLLAAGVLRDIVRGSDVVCYRPTENLFVLALAESDVEHAARALQRIEELFRARLRLSLRTGIARFPDDGLTLDDLLELAASRAAVAAAAGGVLLDHQLSVPQPDVSAL